MVTVVRLAQSQYFRRGALVSRVHGESLEFTRSQSTYISDLHVMDQNTISELEKEYRIIHLVVHRLKNQFRGSYWWGSLQQLHRGAKKLILLTDSYNTHLVKMEKKMRVYQKRKRKEAFERQYTQKYLNMTKTKILNTVRHTLKCVPEMWRQFHGILVLGQFITLGFVLIGCLARVWTLLKSVEGLEVAETAPREASTTLKLEDLGELVEKLAEIKEQVNRAGNDLDQVQEILAKSESPKIKVRHGKDSVGKITKPEKQKKKKKSKKSALAIFDDIFG